MADGPSPSVILNREGVVVKANRGHRPGSAGLPMSSIRAGTRHPFPPPPQRIGQAHPPLELPTAPCVARMAGELVERCHRGTALSRATQSCSRHRTSRASGRASATTTTAIRQRSPGAPGGRRLRRGPAHGHAPPPHRLEQHTAAMQLIYSLRPLSEVSYRGDSSSCRAWGTSAASKAPSSSTARSGPSLRRAGTETTQRPVSSSSTGSTLLQRTDAAPARSTIGTREARRAGSGMPIRR